ncbi:MAG: nucleotide pyrophosphohydrolase [Muribaculaceae bacterium]|nr:nucleotide pyrophosphohydrolase [Muribaculaceae bacterium]
MTIASMQGEVDRWITEIGKGYFPPLANMAILTEEVGELARVIVRRYGPQVAKASDLDRNLEEELADVLWVVACLANQTGVDLTEAFRKTLQKKTERDRERFRSQESGFQQKDGLIGINQDNRD